MIKGIVLILLCAAPLLAPAASHDLRTLIREYDLDGDGSVTKEEFAAQRARRFEATDANRDSGLSRDEYVEEYSKRLALQQPDAKTLEAQMKQAVVRFGVLDSNRDGRISSAEYAYSGWSMFKEHDYSADGVVSVADDVDGERREESRT